MDKKEYQRHHRNTPIGRAINLLTQYNRIDEKYNRGKGDLTAQWIVENIFTKPCAHCGKEGWRVIGCNRIDNDKPHTKDNVEPCCYECNLLEWGKESSKKVYQYTVDGKLVKIFNSIKETEKNGFKRSGVSYCCNGLRKKHGGFTWSFVKKH